MENTLKVINSTNEKYKKSLSAVDEDSKSVMQFVSNNVSGRNEKCPDKEAY